MVKQIKVSKNWDLCRLEWRLLAQEDFVTIGFFNTPKEVEAAVKKYAGSDYTIEWPGGLVSMGEVSPIPVIEEFTCFLGYKSLIGVDKQIWVISDGHKVWVELRKSAYLNGDLRFADGSDTTRIQLCTLLWSIDENGPRLFLGKIGGYRVYASSEYLSIGCNDDSSAWRRIEIARVQAMLKDYPMFKRYVNRYAQH